MATKSSLYADLVNILDEKRVKVDKLERLLYTHDLAPLPKEVGMAFKVLPDAVVRPKSAKEVSALVKYAIQNRIPIVPRGAATWGFGGAVPCRGGIVLDMTTMRGVVRLDKDNMEVEVEAGCVWKNVYDKALRSGLFIASYPSSFLSATVGGWINTGGVGVGTYKYGSVGRNIRNLEVVLPEGQIINTGFNNVSDHSSGYNLNQLFVGAEGTLGVITRVTMQAYPAPELLKPVTVQFENLVKAQPFLQMIARHKIVPLHVYIVDDRHVRHLTQMGKWSGDQGALITLAFEGTKESVAYEESVADQLAAKTGGVRLPDKVAEHEWSERMYEFRFREVGIGSALGEVVVPLSRFTDACRDIYELIAEMKMEASIIGMLGDRSTVALLPYFMYDEENLFKRLTSLSFPKKLGDVALKNGGRPLGFGLFFASMLDKIRGEENAALMRKIKRMLDPNNVMNPGKLVEAETKFGMPIPGMALEMGMDSMAEVKGLMTQDREFKRKAREFRKK